MPRYVRGYTAGSVGVDTLLTCPPCGILVPVLTQLRVTTGATAQTAYVMSPLGIGWTQGYTASGGSATKLSATSVCDNPDGTSQEIAASDIVQLTTEHAGFHATGISSTSGGADITQDATDAFSFVDDASPSFDGSAFLLSDVDGSDADPIEHAGVHFGSLAIANGATINDAKVRFRISSTGPGAANIDYTVYVQDDDDPANPSSHAECLRDLETETKNAQDLSTADVWVEFDITSGLQAVVNRAGWVSGNSLNVYVQLDDIDQSEPTNTVSFYDVGSGSDPEIVVGASGGVSWDTAPAEDVPYGSLFYFYGDKTDPRHIPLRLPANQETVYDDLWIQGGVGTQRGKRAPSSGRGCPQCIVITNTTNAATVELAEWTYIDPASLADEGLLAVPTGKATRYFPPVVEV